MPTTQSNTRATSPVQFSARWSKPWVSPGVAAPVEKKSQELLVKWSVAARERNTKRASVNVTFVLDRSQSMSEAIQAMEPNVRIPSQPWMPNRGIPRPAPYVPVAPMPFPWGPAQPDPFGSGPVWTTSQTSNSPDALGGNAVDLNTMQSIFGSGHAATASQMGIGQNALDVLGQMSAWQPQPSFESAVNKMSLAKDAAWSAIQTLNANDTVSIVSFDNEVRIVCKNVPGSDKQKLRQALDSIVCGGSTALFDGWREGARCVAENMKDNSLNRVVLLTDGQANHGEVRLDKICSMVSQLAQTGVSTSTFGVGLDYNEDLLQSMAQSGDGNYYHISSKDDFLTLFNDEFDGLSSQEGRQVRLEIKLDNPGVSSGNAIWASIQSLNEFALDEQGRMKLPNLMAGRSLEAVFNVEALTQQLGSLNLRLSYVDLSGENQSVTWSVQPPVVQNKEQADSQLCQDVIDAAAILRVAQQKKKAMEALDRGNFELASSTLRTVGAFMASASNAVATSQTMSLSSLAASLDSGDHAGLRKTALYDVYNARSNKSR